MNTDHIVHNTITNRIECQHCVFSEALKMPATIEAIVNKMDAFTEAHKGCTRPQSETLMSEYIQGFDTGYGFALVEIEQYIKRHEYNPNMIAPVLALLAHLKAGDKSDIRESP